jgi:hypothetical protein
MNMNRTQIREISKVFDCYLNQYDSKKYPLEIYKNAKRSFSSKKSSNDEIANALNWKYGNLGKSNFPKSHKSLIIEVEKSWKYFADSKAKDSSRGTFDWWQQRLTNGKSGRFITIAFITHLVHHSKNIPIIDQHNFRAMNYFMNNSTLSPNAKKNPSNWEDIESLESFISEISKSLKRKVDDIDKFLMMFGKELKKK